MTRSFGNRWPQVNCSYPRELKKRYDKENEFDHWFVKYYGHWPFHESILNSNQIPHSHRAPEFSKTGSRGFNELYMAIRYLDAGYEVHCGYRSENEHQCDRSYKMAVEVLGEAHTSVLGLGKGPEPPDLLVVQPGTCKFRFVECKGPSEAPTKGQVKRFLEIEEALNSNPPPCGEPLSDPMREDLFPHLDPGRWIHVVRVVPMPQDSDAL